MRVDQWLSKVCLIKSRSQAKKGCQGGLILLNGESVKESHELRPDEEITLTLPSKELRLRVLEIPGGNVAKRDADRYYELISEEPR
jgi:ribosome-associated heat shock protein Hsp15